MKSIILIGGGGHCKSCVDVVEAEGKYKIYGIIDKKSRSTEPILGYPIIGSDEDFSELRKQCSNALVTVGQIKNAEPRIMLFSQLKELGFELPVIVSPLSRISPHSKVGEGSIVMHHVFVNAGTKVGANCILNSKSLVEHDVVIKEHCHISTGAKVNGGTFIGQRSFVGSGSVIHEKIRIGENCVIAAGSIVREDLSEGTLFRGTI